MVLGLGSGFQGWLADSLLAGLPHRERAAWHDLLFQARLDGLPLGLLLLAAPVGCGREDADDDDGEHDRAVFVFGFGLHGGLLVRVSGGGGGFAGGRLEADGVEEFFEFRHVDGRFRNARPEFHPGIMGELRCHRVGALFEHAQQAVRVDDRLADEDVVFHGGFRLMGGCG